jgi:hypothetical protein
MDNSTILSLTRSLYELNQRQSFTLPRKNKLLFNLFVLATNNVDKKSLFYKYLKNLYSYNRYRPVNLSVRNRYIQTLMTECLKECQKIVESDEDEPDKKAAVLIGINYKGTKGELRGCENDIYSTKKVLLEKYGFSEENILVLTESSNDENLQPTRDNILRAIDWLIEKGNSGFTSLWFQYSGHGYYFEDRNGDEKDGKDECLVTCDNYAIVDDELRLRLVNRVHKDAKLFCLMDCCHSGTMLDLCYKYSMNQNSVIKENNYLTESNVIAISGCMDSQTSADAQFSDGEFAGALTRNFLSLLKKHNYFPKLSVLMRDLYYGLQSQRFTQLPQLTSSKELHKDAMLMI